MYLTGWSLSCQLAIMNLDWKVGTRTCILLFLSGAITQGSTKSFLPLLPLLLLPLLTELDAAISGGGRQMGCCLLLGSDMTVVCIQLLLTLRAPIEDPSILFSRSRLCEYEGVDGVEPDRSCCRDKTWITYNFPTLVLSQTADRG